MESKMSDWEWLGVFILGAAIGGLIIAIVLSVREPTETQENDTLEPSAASCPVCLQCNLSALDYRLYDMELQISALRNYSFMEEELQEFQFLQMILNKFAENHEYNIKTYNCQHFARDIEFIYSSLGYDMAYNGGSDKGADSGHMWNDITISIDASRNQVGYFNDNYDFKYKPKMLSGLKIIRAER